MRNRRNLPVALRNMLACLLCLIALGILYATALAQERQKTSRTQAASPTSTDTPAALKPIVLITGGTGYVDRPTGQSPGVLSSAEIYDPALHRFLPIAAMNERRDQFSAAAIGIDKVLIVGGINTLLVPLNVFPGPAMPWILRSAEVFNSGDGKFVAAPSMKYSRDEPTVTPLQNGKVLIVGGDSPSAELYDPASNTFAETGAMASSRHGQTATLLRDGGVLVAGGGFLKLEVYDPANGKFQFAGKLDDNRLYHTATLLGDGLVLIAGGCPFARSSAVDTSEIFDELGHAVSAGPKMTQSRAGHSATLLADGRVLIAGGRGDKSSEFYDPESHQFVAGPEMVAARTGHSATL
ncbi:MAG TPA: kelch repeat-containing protein, partial [Candidatus Limnocylindrales bacterium]|nr:kelch repeat-containing protein [Candidatus Limnocylindrales bacterium]